jgi:cytochrome c-type biogenesis protein CcmH/NrfG
MALLAKTPAERPADADAVIAALEQMPGGTRGTGPAPSIDRATAPTEAALTPATAPPPPAPPRPRRGPAVALVVALLALGVGAAIVLRGPRHQTTGAATPEEPPFPSACDPALARKLAEVRGGGIPDADAVPRLGAIAAACPSAAVARALLGTALTRLDRDGEAEPHLRAALSLAPDYANAQHNLAVLLVKRGRAAEALPLLDAVLARDPAHATARVARAQARLVAGNVAGAVDDLRVQTERRPDHGAGWTLLAEALSRSGDAAGAKAAACRASALGVASARERCGSAPDSP